MEYECFRDLKSKDTLKVKCQIKRKGTEKERRIGNFHLLELFLGSGFLSCSLLWGSSGGGLLGSLLGGGLLGGGLLDGL